MRVATIAGALGVVVVSAVLYVALADRGTSDRNGVLAATHTVGPQAVRTDDGGAACVLRGGRLLCANLLTQAKTPPVSLRLDADGQTSAVDADLRWSTETPALRAGERADLGDYSCSATELQLICSARAGGSALGVDAAHLSVTAAPAVAP